MEVKQVTNRIITAQHLAEIKHYGVLGMKWGIRKSDRKTRRLAGQVRGTVKKFDKGKDPDVQNISKKVRRQKYKTERSIQKVERFLAKNAKANAQGIVNRYNKDPRKKALAENYIKSMNLNVTTLAELRLQLIDIRV